MTLQVYYERDANPEALKNATVAVLGYGAQGHAHALNLRDSGHDVIVAQRPGGANHARATADGFTPLTIAEAVERADLVIFALPDEQAGDIFEGEVRRRLRPHQALGFLHGFAIRFEAVRPPADVDVLMVAPKGPGTLVRDAFLRGGGLASIIAVHQDATGRAKEIALAWGLGIGAGKGGMIETTFASECESDLFGEQTVLCGGVIELMKAAFELLVEAGVPPELAYFECMHELKQITDLQYAGGLAFMRSRISGTASYGGLTRGPRLIDERVRATMRDILKEIQSGAFAREWIEECRRGRPALSALKAAEAAHPSEAAGRAVRELAQGAMVR